MRALKILGKILISLTISISLIALCMGLFWLSVMAWPQIFFNNKLPQVIAKASELAGVELTWKQAGIEVHSRSFTTKELRLNFENLCYREPKYRVCFDLVDLTLALKLNSLKNPIAQIGPGILDGGDIFADLRQTEEESRKPSQPFDYYKIVNQISAMGIQPLDVRLKNIELITNDRHMSGRLQLIVSVDPVEKNWNIQTILDNLKGAPIENFNLSLSAKDFREGQKIPQNISGKLSAKLEKNGQVSVDLLTKPSSKPHEIKYDLSAIYVKGRERLNVQSTGLWFEPVLHGTFSLEAINFSDKIKRLVLTPCSYNLRHNTDSSAFLKVSGNCQGKALRTELTAAEYKVLIPQNLGFNLKTHLELLAEEGINRFRSSWNVDIDPIKNEIMLLSGGTQGKVAGIVGAPLSQLEATADIDMKMQVPKFTNLVRQLNATSWAIPAPLNVLEGSIDCYARGRFRTANELLIVPYDCTTNLASRTQSLKSMVSGTFNLETGEGHRAAHVAGDILIKDLQVVLPNIRLDTPLPRLLYDNRISRPKSSKPKNSLNLNYDFSIKTEHSNSIRVVTNILPEPIPIEANIRTASDKPLSGDIRIANYEAELFRREAYIKRLGLRFDPNTRDKEIDGRVKFETLDYDVDLLVAGTLSRPSFRFYSNPPLPEGDIMALLLFGRTPEDLDMDQKRSAEETRAAAADGAIGLLSMFYLASTPIESVGYNPHTGMFTAKMSLGRGISLSVGANNESEQRIGLRRRMGRNWTVETTAIRDKQNDTTKGVAMFTWSRRY